MAEGVAAISRQTLETQLDSVRFIDGIERGRWTLLRDSFPDLYVRVTVNAPGKTFSQDFHLECAGYPDPGPFVERWAFADTPSAGQRPPPLQGSDGSPGFIDALKDWHESNQSVHGGVYRAWQRGAAGHNAWTSKRPEEAWHRNRNIVFIMEHLYALVSEQAHWLASRAA